jgi:tRNA pseudouridine13 synthase
MASASSASSSAFAATASSSAKRSFDAVAGAGAGGAGGDDDAVLESDFAHEAMMGITQFLDTRASRVAFHGILKHVCADFVVDEVTRDGAVVRLTDALTVPPKPTLPVEGVPSDAEWRAAHVCDADVARFRAFLAAGDKAATFEFGAELAASKESRTALHKLVKRMQRPLVSRTLTDPQRIVVAFVGADAAVFGAGDEAGGAARSHHDASGKLRSDVEPWPVKDQRFLSFVLCKQNVDTQNALGTLSRALNVPESAFAVAGNKDKRGITTQRVTAFKLHAERLVGLQPRVAATMRFGNFRYVAENLQLGEHGANRFGIVVRDVSLPDDAPLVEACEALREHGFLNYFGLQRFGGSDAGCATSDVGRLLLQRDFRGAVRAILAERTADAADVRAARRLYLEANDAAAAFAAMPQRSHALVNERAILGALAKRPTDFAGALNVVPRNLRLMYLHAWQSHTFNAALSERMQRFGSAVVPGDLVWVDAAQQTVREVTAHDAASGGLTLRDVVLPVIGHSTVLPGHAVADVYAAALGASRLDKSSFQHAIFDLPGVYRSVVARPLDFAYRIARYADAQLPLIRTPFLAPDAPLGDDAGGAHRALVLEFQLPPSSYATMLFRELMRTGTSKDAQRTKSLKLREDEAASRHEEQSAT